MTVKPTIRRAVADSDIDDAIGYYVDQGGETLAMRFVERLQAAIDHIGAHPRVCSPRYSEIANVAGLRCWPVGGFPYLVFFIEREDHIDLWRVLHSRRDVLERFEPE